MLDLRHHQAMVKGESGGTNPWLRASKWLRISAWLPPGLALGWLATLATLIHSVGIALAAWGATVSVVLLLLLLVSRLQRAATRNASVANQVPAEVEEATQPDASSSGACGETAPPRADTDADPHPGRTLMSVLSIGASPPAPELQVLTAEEVASVLRVDTDLVITSISNGEFPGNRIGSHWLVDKGALSRWLQGPYGSR